MNVPDAEDAIETIGIAQQEKLRMTSKRMTVVATNDLNTWNAADAPMKSLGVGVLAYLKPGSHWDAVYY